MTNYGFAYCDYHVHVYGQSEVTNAFEGLGATSFFVEAISGLENPSVSIANANSSAGTFTVNVRETNLSKRVSSLKLDVISKTNSQRSRQYVAGLSSYGNISQSVSLKDISSEAGTYSVTATIVYSDNSTYTVALADQSYTAQAAASPRITTYINESNTYPAGQCTWAVKSLAPWIPNYLGNANMWVINASAKGFRTGSTPAVGAIAVWPKDGGGYGHVAYVTHVESNTRIQVQEANYAGKQYISNFRGWFNPLASTWGGTVTYIYPN